MIFSLLFIAAIALLVVLVRKIASSSTPQLPVLMYHKISNDGSCDDLTVTSKMLERQFHHLQREGFTPLLLSEVVAYVKHKRPLPENPVLITFDDGYRNNFTVMYPLLRKYDMKANIFLVPTLLQRGADNTNEDGFLSPADIRHMDSNMVEFGLHSFDHCNYKRLSLKELYADINKSKKALQSQGIPFQPCLAFPYGAYPKKNPFKLRYFFETLALNKVELAFRIGNRLNPLPLRNPRLIQRLDIKGDMPFAQFASYMHKCKSRSKRRFTSIPVPPMSPSYENMLT